MKARKVQGLEAEGEFGDQLARIVRTRTDELYAFMPEAADPTQPAHLHDMRIAAKRLRYALELAEDSFGAYAATATKRVKALQDLLGEIHDCDVALPRVLALAAEARATDAVTARERAGEAVDLLPRWAADAPNAQSHRGLATLATYHQARRDLLFERFLAFWEALLRDGLRARLEYAAAERPAADGRSQDGGSTGPAVAVTSGGSTP